MENGKLGCRNEIAFRFRLLRLSGMIKVMGYFFRKLIGVQELTHLLNGKYLYRQYQDQENIDNSFTHNELQM